MSEEIDKRTDTMRDRDPIEMEGIVGIEIEEIEEIEDKEIDQGKKNNTKKENITDKADREIIKKGVIKKAKTIERAEIVNNIRKNIKKIGQDRMREIETIDI